MIKILFILSLLAIYPFFWKTENGKKLYFLIAVIMTFVRELNIPGIGNIVPATLMFWIMFIVEVYRSLSILQTWLCYSLILIISLLIGILTNDTIRAFSWETPLWNTMIIAILTPLYIKTDDDMQSFVKCILTVSFIYSFTTLLAYWGYYDGTVILSITDSSITNQSRIYGISYSNLVQTISVITICLIPHVIINKYLKYILIFLFAYAVLITLKRMSFIALLISIVYLIIIEIQNKQYKSVIIISIIGIIIVGSSWWEMVINRFNIFSDNKIVATQIKDHSSQTRVDRIIFSINIFEQSPLLGKGAGYVVYIHNGFLEILANCGIIGILCIFTRYLKPLKDTFNLNPWSISTLIFLVTCFSLEAAISRSELMCFLGLFIGGYTVSKNLQIEYVMNNDKK